MTDRRKPEHAELRIPIEGWPKRIADVLLAENVRTWGDLAKLSPGQLLKHKRFGVGCLVFVEQALSKRGLELSSGLSPGRAPTARGAGDHPGVYFLACASYIKIGCATKIRQRLIDLMLLLPFDADVLATIPTDTYQQACELERDLHARFSDKRHRGEWFHDHPDIRKAFE